MIFWQKIEQTGKTEKPRERMRGEYYYPNFFFCFFFSLPIFCQKIIIHEINGLKMLETNFLKQK